jgi:hypothetical protein
MINRRWNHWTRVELIRTPIIAAKHRDRQIMEDSLEYVSIVRNPR